MQADRQLEALKEIAVAAGQEILAVYNQEEVINVTLKDDNSPLTEADRRAHRLIVDRLALLTPGVPVLSEESEPTDWSVRSQWDRYWLVDPLDGTKEFVKRNGEFTVNIANYFWLTLVPKAYSQEHGVSEQTAQAILHKKYAETHGTLNWYCLDYWEAELRLNITELKTTIKHKICSRPNVEKLLKELQINNKRLLLITNAHPSSLAIKMKHTGIGKYFHKHISSHTLKLAKENHGFWKTLQEIEPYKPERSLLFDDSLPVLRQAKREGIKYLYGIKQPDSQKASLPPAEFPQIGDFKDIMPPRMISE